MLYLLQWIFRITYRVYPQGYRLQHAFVEHLVFAHNNSICINVQSCKLYLDVWKSSVCIIHIVLGFPHFCSLSDDFLIIVQTCFSEECPQVAQRMPLFSQGIKFDYC